VGGRGEPARWRRKWCYGKTQQGVSKKLVALRRGRDDGPPMPSGRRTVAEYLESWLEMRAPSVRPDAHASYAFSCRKHIIPTLGRAQLSKLSAEQVQKRLSAKLITSGLSPTTVRHIHAVLRNALNEAVQLNIVPCNVA